MMNRARRWAGLAGTMLMAWGAGAAADTQPAQETRPLPEPFHEVRLLGDIDLELVQGDRVSLVIEAPREDLPEIVSEVSGGVLTLKPRSESPKFFRWFSHRFAARALLTAPSLDRIAIRGSGSVHAGAWGSDALEVRISGSGGARFDDLKARRFAVDVAGSGDIAATGSVGAQKIEIAGSGDYRGGSLKSRTASVSISGSGEADLWVQDALDARIAGAGSVRYYGAPTVTQSVSGSGSLKSLGAKS
jgi:hypothetical protein